MKTHPQIHFGLGYIKGHVSRYDVGQYMPADSSEFQAAIDDTTFLICAPLE